MSLASDSPPAGRSQSDRDTRRGLRAGLNDAASGVDQGSLMGTELLAGILIWTVLGWLADRWLGTTPWLLGLGAMVGFAGGLYLVWLRSGRMEDADASRRRADRPADG